MRHPHRPLTFVAVLAALSFVAIAVLAVLVTATLTGVGGTTITGPRRIEAILLAVGAEFAVNVVFLAWYLSPHLVHQVRPLRPLHSAARPGETARDHDRRVQATPTQHLLGSRLLLLVIYLAPLVALGVLILPLSLDGGQRIDVAALFDYIALAAGLIGSGILVWRWFSARNEPRTKLA